MRQLFLELKRRNVYKVATTYAVVGFVVIQAANLIFPALDIPGWAYSLVVVLTLLGFPIALVLAWAFELTPEGIRRTAREAQAAAPAEAVRETDGSIAPRAGGAAVWIVALVVLLAAGGGAWLLTADGGESPPGEAVATDTGASTAAATGDRTEADGPPRIAVLPFDNIAADSANDFFTEGMHEEVLSQLAKMASLEVISRTSVMQYEGSDKSVREISRELGGVRALLEGSVRRAGNLVLVTAQLIDARRDAHLWTETYERELSVEEIFEIQADIARRIAGSLEARLTEGERERIEDVPTSDLAAYDAYLKGLTQWNRFTTGDPAYLERAIEHFREAVGRDSSFVEAYSALAHSYVNRYDFVESDPRWLDSATAYVDRANSLDPNSADALISRSYLYLLRDSLDAAQQAAERLRELEPNNEEVAGRLSDIAASRGHVVEAVRWSHRAFRLDPRNSWYAVEMGFRLHTIGMVDAAEAWYRHALELNPDRYASVQALIQLYLGRGEIGRARAVLQSFRARHPENLGALSLEARIALEAGNPEKARAHLQRISEERREDQGSPSTPGPEHLTLRLAERIDLGLAQMRLGNRARGRELLTAAADSMRRELQAKPTMLTRALQLAGALAALGERREALARLERAAEGDRFSADIFVGSAYSHLFDELRSEPRFQALVREAEAREEEARQEVRKLGIDLWPPGVGPDTAAQKARADE